MHPTAAVYKFSVSKAHKAQLSLSQRIVTEDRLPQEIKLIAGIDAAYTDEQALGVATVLDYESLELLERQTAICKVKFPYIPTLLSFREIPPVVACIRKLNLQPEVLLVDGRGIAHPYGCGFASHLGLLMGKSTVGVAKNKLIGEPKILTGHELLVQNGRVIGEVVTKKKGIKPVYVSVGHLIAFETAVKIVKHCACNSRIPEPILQAHKIASEERARRK
jgi:deoxyribonuclease V